MGLKAPTPSQITQLVEIYRQNFSELKRVPESRLFVHLLKQVFHDLLSIQPTNFQLPVFCLFTHISSLHAYYL